MEPRDHHKPGGLVAKNYQDFRLQDLYIELQLYLFTYSQQWGGAHSFQGGTRQALSKCLLCDWHIKMHCSLQERRQAWKPRHTEAMTSLKRGGARSVESAPYLSTPGTPASIRLHHPRHPLGLEPFRWHLSNVPAITNPSRVTSPSVTSPSALHGCSQAKGF